MQRLSLLIILIISIASNLSNYKVFDLNIEQNKLTNYLSAGTIAEIDKDYLDKISTNYPSLSSTVIPFKSITGTYWLQNDSILKGLELLYKANKDSPYLGFPDAMLASFYEFIGVKDSFNFYARSAYNKLPNAPQHYVLISKLFVNEDKIDSLEIFFENIKDRLYDEQVFKIYLAAAIKNQDKMDSLILKENIVLSKSLFSRNPDISLLTDYLVYGEDKIKNTVKLKQQAIDSFNINPEFSIKAMKKVVDNVRDNIDNYEVLIEMYFKNGNYDEVINLYSFLNQNNNAVTFRAFIIELIAISYINKRDLESGCSLALTLKNLNYPVINELRAICNIN